MAGSLPDSSGNIYVEFDYNNIIVVDPNKVIDKENNISERLVDHENLVIYANLEAYITPRTKLALGQIGQVQQQNIKIASINFLKGQDNNGNYFTTGYYDELTGKNTTEGKGQNQVFENKVVDQKSKQTYINREIKNVEDNGLFGIREISVNINSSFIPEVTIQFEDVQGKALFQLGDSSPYAAFFNLPYPPFYLTLKGYYGKAVRYQLNLVDFNARLNTTSGNYEISTKFYGYKFNILNEISISHLLATPHMFSKKYNVSLRSDNSQNNDSEAVGQVVTERGYQKIQEVYNEYKVKELIDKDFPELTLAQLMKKMEQFEQNVLDSYEKTDVQPLTDCRTYIRWLDTYLNQIYGKSNSWFTKSCDVTKPIYLKNGAGVFYKIKRDNETVRKYNYDLLKQKIDLYNGKLAENQTINKNEITNSITIDTFLIQPTSADIDFVKTLNLLDNTNYKEGEARFNVRVSAFTKYDLGIEITGERIQVVNDKDKTEPTPYFYIFEGPNRFKDLIGKMDSIANQKLSDYEVKITNDLKNKIADKELGIGFDPTARNFIAVIMANAEAFLRLMDETHYKAWNLRNDPNRKLSILNNSNSAKSSDDVHDNPEESFVYPWPQFFEESPNDKKGRFELKYLADPTVVGRTKGNDYRIWPEVEFVEEYQKGLAQRYEPPENQEPLGSEDFTKILSINAIEFPNSKIAYSLKEQNKFLYEIWERQFLTTRYTNLIRLKDQIENIIAIVSSAETENIVVSLGASNPDLTSTLKNLNVDGQGYSDFLKEISNQGTGGNYKRFESDLFVTNYITSLTEKNSLKSFEILELTELGSTPTTKIDKEKLNELVLGNTEFIITDTFPFTNKTWVDNNMVSIGNVSTNILDTKRTIGIYEPRNVFANFKILNDYTTNRPVTNFSFISDNQLSNTLRVTPDLFYPTQGYSSNDTTSIMNTPYFVNSILQSVDKIKSGDSHPFVAPAYLFLNSLPLITPREKLKTFENKITIDKDYIFAALKNLGAIHKLPYAWVLKIGSIWHRYKTYIEKNVDILDGCWKDFDYNYYFNPKGTPNKQYTFKTERKSTTISLVTETTGQINLNYGFYPKAISDFNYLINGKDLYTNYDDTEIQNSINNGLFVYNNVEQNIIGLIQGTKSVSYRPYSVVIPANIDNSQNQTCDAKSGTTPTGYIVPSFGSIINSSWNNISNKASNPGVVLTKENVDVRTDKAITNGSVRLFWEAPNFGYFDTSNLIKPDYKSYLNKIEIQSLLQMSPFKILSSNDYTTIEEIFSVFNKDILDELETKFLDFCRKDTNMSVKSGEAKFGESSYDINWYLKNFHSLFKKIIEVGEINKTNEKTFFDTAVKTQTTKIYNYVKSFLEYDVLIKFGNPNDYDRRIFDSYISHGQQPILQNPIKFKPYVQGSLPGDSLSTTLAKSKSMNPDAWKKLQTEIGFSTIQGLNYTDNGSNITDFFIDNNIEFTSDNIKILRSLIRIYATQKNQFGASVSQVKSLLNTYSTDCTNLQNQILDYVIKNLNGRLKDYTIQDAEPINSAIDGDLNKVELYEIFKALNDKWVAGTDYSNKTLFEDIMFLDRASRNVGQKVYLDIFSIKKFFTEKNMDATFSVYRLIGDILIENNFVIMNLPSYINFYNVQDITGIDKPKIEGSLDFADSFWGTFLNVDYRDSSSKMVCFYSSRPSNYLDMKDNKVFLFRDDGFEIRRGSDCPLIEDWQNKKDWGLSNRCVGFNVDFGIRNQNIFSTLRVAQQNGKATSEAIKAQLNIIDNVSGKGVSTQNVSLYNFYKQRSYEAEIYCMGNAMIQPSMYFNLRHVPMFNGPYLILNVTHTINSGQFETKFLGVRQGIFDLPAIDSYLQSLNRNLLTRLESVVKNKKDNSSTQSQSNSDKTPNSSSVPTQNDCEKSILAKYKTGDNAVIQENKLLQTTLNSQDFVKVLNSSTTNETIKATIFTISYLKSGQNQVFNSNAHNYAKIAYDFDWGLTLNTYAEPTYYCEIISKVSNINITSAQAMFSSSENFVNFMRDRLNQNTSRILSNGLLDYYLKSWPPIRTSSEVEEFKAETELKMREALRIAESLGIKVGNIEILIKGTNSLKNKNPNNINTIPVSCNPIITGFSPLQGNSNTQITISGTNLTSIYDVTISGERAKILSWNNSTNVVITPPSKSGKIKIITNGGSTESSDVFTFT